MLHDMIRASTDACGDAPRKRESKAGPTFEKSDRMKVAICHDLGIRKGTEGIVDVKLLMFST